MNRGTPHIAGGCNSNCAAKRHKRSNSIRRSSNPYRPHSSAVTTSDATVESAAQLIRRVFGGSADGDTLAPETLVSQMEAALGAKRDSWPISAIRRFGDVLIEVAAGRKKSPRHEVRWLNLFGFCLRPGFGVPGDDARVNGSRTIASNELVFADDLQCQIEMLVLLRRIAGGINASEQQVLYRKHTSGVGRKKKGRVNRHFEYEAWRLVASLEHLPASTRASLGNELLAKIRKEPEDAIWLWSLGRLGARIPLYGPLHSVVAAEIAGEWLKALLELSSFTAATASAAIVPIARRTDDHSRDIDDAIREQAIARLSGAWDRRRNHPASVKVRPARTGRRGPQLRGVAAARVASCELFELLAVGTRVAQL